MHSLESYRLSRVTGAMLENPLQRLPLKWEAWNTIAGQLPELSKNRKLRSEVESLPLLDVNGLESHEELRLAHKILAFITSVYVWQDGEGGEVESLPAQIAQPLLSVSEKLGSQPILTHADLVLCNCIPSTSSNESKCGSFLKDVHRPTFHHSWEAFITLTGECEIYFAPILQEVMNAIEAQNPLDEERIAESLENIVQKFLPFRKSLMKFYGKLYPEEFYVHLRPILSGWTCGRLKDKGLVYKTSTHQGKIKDGMSVSNGCPFTNNETCTKSGTGRTCIGASAAQSISLQTCDALLQIKHNPEDEEFLRKMQSYMIKEHRQFLKDLANCSRIRFIANESKSPRLKTAYNDCLQSLWNFRNSHISLVNRFIIEPAKTEAARIESLKFSGTGGQNLRIFLQRVRDASSSSSV
uniref:Indoleamine 2,3-dioxygenase n=1 Tax=Trichobilharzia regenti TaxID=157069 RepID=A0AA85J4U7_TRIRE|nr:unnamed protein product [Trichobilharzia regenti]